MSATTLELRRAFAAPRAAVFAAWTDPDALTRWWGGALAETISAAVDLRAGGSFRLSMRAGERAFALIGTYREVAPPERLVYSWRWEGVDLPGEPESLVTVEFRERDGGTEVVVVHEALTTGAALRFHDRGWTASLERLGALLAPAPARGG